MRRHLQSSLQLVVAPLGLYPGLVRPLHLRPEMFNVVKQLLQMPHFPVRVTRDAIPILQQLQQKIDGGLLLVLYLNSRVEQRIGQLSRRPVTRRVITLICEFLLVFSNNREARLSGLFKLIINEPKSQLGLPSGNK